MKVERNKREIHKMISYKLSSMRTSRDDELRNSYNNQKSVFDLYSSYVDLVKPKKK